MIKNTALLLLFFIFINSVGYANAITDDFAEKTLDKNLETKEKAYKPIYDEFAEKNKNKNTVNQIIIQYNEVLPANAEKEIRKTKDIDYSNLKPLEIRIKKNFSSRQKIQEGDFLEFETVNDITLNNKIYPKGTTVKARIETVSLNKPMGIPSDLVIGNFAIENNNLIGEISKTGANRALWVYPLSFGTMGFFGIGLLFMPIRGGHAKIKTSKTYTIYTD